MSKVKYAVSKKVVKVIRDVQRYWREENNRLDMGDWGTFLANRKPGQVISDDSDNSMVVPACRTTACLAGTVVLLTKEGRKFLRENGYFNKVKNRKKTHRGVVNFPNGVVGLAANILEANDTSSLFYVDGWPEPYQSEYSDATNAKQRVRAAIRRTEHFIRTGE